MDFFNSFIYFTQALISRSFCINTFISAGMFWKVCNFFLSNFFHSKKFKTFLDFFTKSPANAPCCVFYFHLFYSISNVFHLLLTSFLSHFVSVARIAILSPKAGVLMRYILTRFNHILVSRKWMIYFTKIIFLWNLDQNMIKSR